METPTRRVSVRTWVSGHKKLLILTAGIFVVAVILVQLLYPQGRGLPFASFNGQSVATTERNEIAALIQKKFLEATIELKVEGSLETISLLKAGATPNTDKMTDLLTGYPLWLRLVPFSLALHQPQVNMLDVYFDVPQLQKTAEELAGKIHHAPEDARLAIEKGKLVVTHAESGYTVEPSEIVRQLSVTEFTPGKTTVPLPTKEIPPTRSDRDIDPVRRQAEAAIKRAITIEGPKGEMYTPGAETIASWLSIETRKNGSVRLVIDEGRVAKYVEWLNGKVKIDPGVTRVHMVDGKETNRMDGSVGQEIEADTLVNELKKAVMEPEAPRELTIEMRTVPSVVVNDRRYTSSQKGLQAYVDYATSTQDVHISLVQLNGARWKAHGRAGDSIPSASTYKLFVSLVLFDRIEKQQIKWSDKMLDTTVDGCFERMIVPSTNPCAESWIAQFGRQYINDFVHARGFSKATSFTTNTANHTSARDLANYMVGLYNGTLVKGELREKLLEKMGRQLYRYGIPTGTAGWAQDKVGFLWDYVHDTAIVHHPKGTYAVAIMTRGQSYAHIAQITRELERIMYP